MKTASTLKKKYYALDDIGFVGTQAKRSARQIRLDQEATAEFIAKQKAGKVKLRKSVLR